MNAFSNMSRALALILAAPLAAVPASAASAPAEASAEARWTDINQRAEQAFAAGQYDQAIPFAEQALAIAEASFPVDHPHRLTSLNNIAALHHMQGRTAEAIPIAERAAAGFERALGPDHEETVNALENLATMRFATGDAVRAEPLFRRVLDARRRAAGETAGATLAATVRLAQLLIDRNRHAEAETLLAPAHRASLAANGAEHEDSRMLADWLAAARSPAQQPSAGPPPGADGRDGASAQWLAIANRVTEAHGRGDLAEAERAAREAIAFAEAHFPPDHLHRITSTNNLAFVFDAQGRYPEAEPLYREVLGQIERLLGPQSGDLVTPLSNLAVVYIRQRRFAEAEPLLVRALAIGEPIVGRVHPAMRLVVANLAKLHEEQGRYAEAEPYYRSLLEVTERLSGPDDQQTLIAANELAALLFKLGRYADAEPFYRRALDGARTRLGRDHSDTLTYAANLAVLLSQTGRYGEAEALQIEAVDLRGRRLGPDHEDTLHSVASLATLYYNQGRHSEAEPLLVRALEASERTAGADAPITLTFRSSLANLYDSLGRTDEGRELNRQVMASRERVLGPDHPETIESRTALGITLAEMDDEAGAEPLLRTSLAAAERVLGADHPETLRARAALGAALRGLGRDSEAEPLLLAAATVYRRVHGPSHPLTIETSSILASARLALGNAEGALDPSRRVLAGLRERRSGADLDSAAAAQRDREERQRPLYYSQFADIAWAARDPARPLDPALGSEVFAALQDSSAGSASRAVVQMAVRRLADRTGEGLGALVRERETLVAQWDLINRSYSAALASQEPDAETLRRNLLAQRSGIDARTAEIDARLRREFPQFFALVQPEPMNLEAAQALLAPDEAILMVVPAGFGTHVFAITRDSVEWQRSALTRRQLAEPVQRLLWDVGANVQVDAERSARWEQEGGSGYPFDRSTAHFLYRELVAPVAGTLAGKRHVFVAASGALSSLPFGLLVTEAPQGEDGDPAALRSTAWFADAHALSQIPSVQSLRFLREAAAGDRSEGPQSFVGFGDPALLGQAQARGRNRGGSAPAAADVFAGPATRSGGGSLVNLRQLRYMSRLPGTAVELEAMRTALDAPPQSVFLAERATERALRSADLSNARILALATHGLMAGEISGAAEPGLVFTPPEQASEEDDGLLTASEVASLRLDADWVILSACNTAAGDGSEGAPGLSGLARAFFYAGARTLLASHWPVRDDVSARLTVRTLEIQRAQPQLSRAEAFQRAMREIREDSSHDSADDSWAHPNAWAPFTLIGDGAR